MAKNAAIAPGTAEWDETFKKARATWPVVPITPETAKRFAQLSVRVSEPTIFQLSPGVYKGPIVLSSSFPCIVEAAPAAGYSAIAEDHTNDEGALASKSLDAAESETEGEIEVGSRSGSNGAPAVVIRSNSGANAVLAVACPAAIITRVSVCGGAGGAVHVREGSACVLERCFLECAAAPSTMPDADDHTCPYAALRVDSGNACCTACEFLGGFVGLLAARPTTNSQQQRRIKVVGCVFRGPRLRHGVACDAATHIDCRNSRFVGLAGHALQLRGATTGAISGCAVSECAGAGVIVDGLCRVWISGTRVHQCGGPGLVCGGSSRPCIQHSSFTTNNSNSSNSDGCSAQVVMHCSTCATFRSNTVEFLAPAFSAANAPLGTRRHDDSSASSSSSSSSSDDDDDNSERSSDRKELLTPSRAKENGNENDKVNDNGNDNDGSNEKKRLRDGSCEVGGIPVSLGELTSTAPTTTGAFEPQARASHAPNLCPPLPHAPPPSRAPQCCVGVALLHCSDAVIEGNHIIVTVGPDEGCRAVPPAGSKATRAAMFVDGSSTASITRNRLELRAHEGGRSALLEEGTAADGQEEGQQILHSMAAFVLGPFQNAKCADNNLLGFAPLRCFVAIDEAGVLDSSLLDAISLRQCSAPRAAHSTTVGSTVSPAAAPSACAEGTSRSASRLALPWSSCGTAGSPRKPQQPPHERAASTPTNLTHMGPASAATSAGGGDREVVALRMEVERLKARLRMKTAAATNQASAHHPSRPSSANARSISAAGDLAHSASSGRPQSAAGSSGGKMSGAAPSPRSQPRFARPAVVGRYTWDMSRMADFLRLRAPLSEVRVEREDASAPRPGKHSDAASRLHDGWLKEQRERQQQRAERLEREREARRKLCAAELRESVHRLHDESCKHKEETLREMAQKLSDREAKERESPHRRHRQQRVMTEEDLAAFNARMFTEHQRHRKELEAKLWRRYVVGEDHRPKVRQPRETIEAYCASLHAAHKRADLAKAAADAIGVQRVYVRPPRRRQGSGRRAAARRSRGELEAYCASLYLSHHDADAAEAAARAAGDDVVVRVASRSASRAATRTPRPPPSRQQHAR